MTLSAGSAASFYTLDISGLRTAVATAKQELASLRAEAAKPLPVASVPRASVPATPVRNTANAPDAALIQRNTERAILARANAEARLVQIQNTGKNALAGLTQAERIYATALTQVDRNSTAAIRTQSQLAAIRNRMANLPGGGLPILPRTVESFGTQAIDQFKSGLLGLVGPAAVVTAGFAAATATVDSFKRAFIFKAELDAQNLAIQTNLKGIRDSAAVFDEAARFANKYRLTQQETAEILSNSTDILRTSTSSVTNLESALLRLQSRDVSKPISEAARALRELNSGDVTSIKELFNVPAAEALKMKNEIAGGADAVQVLNGYLDRAGVGMEVLENRAKGAAGAINEQKIAAEELALAQGKIASSKGGILLVQEQSRLYRGLANLLNGDVLAGLKATATEFVANQTALQAYNAAIAAGKSEVEAAAIQQDVYNQVLAETQRMEGLLPPAIQNHSKEVRALTTATQESAFALSKENLQKLEGQIATDRLAQEQLQLERDSRLAAQGMLGAGNQALILAEKYGIATQQAQFLINQQQALTNASALADQRLGERSGGKENNAAQFAGQSRLIRERQQQDAAENKRASERAAQDAAQLQAARDNLALSRAKTSAEKIAILRQQQQRAATETEKLQIQAQIENERKSNSRASASTAGKGLSSLDRSEIALIDDAQTKLAEINKRLASGNITQLQRNQLLKQQRDLQREIADEARKELEDQLSLQESLINDRKARRDEDRNLKLLGRLAGRGGDRGQAAADEIALIEIARKRRELGIDRLQETTGGVLPNVGTLTPRDVLQATSAPLVSSQPTQSAGTQSGLTVNLNINGRTIATEIIPDILSALQGGIRGARNAGT